jgi:hypothetical protein
MAIPVTCEGCGARFKAPDAAAGKKGKCKKCGASILVPVPEAVGAAAEDDLYDLAGATPPPTPTRTTTSSPSLPPQAAPYNPTRPPASAASAAMMSRGVVPKSPGAGAWKTAHNPPTIMKVLGVVVGVVLILLGLLIAAGPVLAMMSDKTGKTIRFKGVVIGVTLIVTGVTAIAKALGKGEE